MRRIEEKHFGKSADFGSEGLIPPLIERNFGPKTHPKLIIKHMVGCRSLIDKSSPFLKRFSEADCEKMVHEIFGDKDPVVVADALAMLRPRAHESPEMRLLIRALATHSYDQLSPEQTKRINPLQHYEDLHIMDREILPEARKSGASNFLIYRLTLDELELPNSFYQTRLHIYPPGENNQINADSVVHEHLGDSSSIILAGQVVNQHHKVTQSDQPGPGRESLYEVSTNIKPDGIERTFDRKGFATGVDVVSNHTYEPGDYYHLPGTLKPENKQMAQLFSVPEMDLTYHSVANKELTTTLFVQRRMPYNAKDMVVLDDRGDRFEFHDHQYTAENPDVAYRLLTEADQKIRQQLAGKDRVNCTHLAQLTSRALRLDGEAAAPPR